MKKKKSHRRLRRAKTELAVHIWDDYFRRCNTYPLDILDREVYDLAKCFDITQDELDYAKWKTEKKMKSQCGE